MEAVRKIKDQNLSRASVSKLRLQSWEVPVLTSDPWTQMLDGGTDVYITITEVLAVTL